MIEKYKVLNNQTVTDIAVQEIGSALGVIDLAVANNISPTEKLTPGQLLIIPVSRYENKTVKAFFKAKGLTVATKTVRVVTDGINDYVFPGIFPF